MDYIVASTLTVLKPHGPLLLSYDIACQWKKNISKRLTANLFPAHFSLLIPDHNLCFAIPKYHFRAHKEEGHTIFSLWLLRGAAISDCKEIEWAWWKFEGTQASIHKMGPGLTQHPSRSFQVGKLVQVHNTGWVPNAFYAPVNG